MNILKYGKSDLKKENHLLALEKEEEEEKENTRDRSAHDGSNKKVGIMDDKQDHQWWRYHRRLFDYQSPYF